MSSGDLAAASAWSVALLGLDGTPIEVEAAVGAGLPRTVLVGLPDTALYEARDRCRAAVASSGLHWPSQLLTINLTPASLPKAGSHYDLAIVAAVLACAGTVPQPVAQRCILMGELGLNGRVRAVRGILPGLLVAQRAGFTTAIVPATQQREAELVAGMTVLGVDNLGELVEALHDRPVLRRSLASRPATHAGSAPGGAARDGTEHGDAAGEAALEDPAEENPPFPPGVPEGDAAVDQADLSDVVGQPQACWALEVAAAGGHHVYLHGEPGVGKTMLAQRLPGLLPDLDAESSVEVSAVHSLAGRSLDNGLVVRPPLCDPHHSISLPALIGGGSRFPRPGAISLAHRGVLFLDEAPEFSPRALEALRTPLESGVVTIGRAGYLVRFPADFQLIIAANPCPCGQASSAGQRCTCTPMAIRRYAQRLSGPILDRIDIHVQMQQPRHAVQDLLSIRGPTTKAVACRVRTARDRQAVRLASTPWRLNADLPGRFLRRDLPKPEGLELLEKAVSTGRLSARGVDKVLRLAWTLADLAGRDRPSKQDLTGAMGLRSAQLLQGG
jgi:magnesium chelatase family protein